MDKSRRSLRSTSWLEYRRLTDKTITNRQDLEREIQVALAQGYYVAEEDLEPGLISIGAPVRDETGQIIAALSLVIPTVRYTEEHKRQSIELIVDAARRLSKKLGYVDINHRA
jgi:IclR family KDG regulon transcriptional repressor